jgi:hypothetical protein
MLEYTINSSYFSPINKINPIVVQSPIDIRWLKTCYSSYLESISFIILFVSPVRIIVSITKSETVYVYMSLLCLPFFDMYMWYSAVQKKHIKRKREKRDGIIIIDVFLDILLFDYAQRQQNGILKYYKL